MNKRSKGRMSTKEDKTYIQNNLSQLRRVLVRLGRNKEMKDRFSDFGWTKVTADWLIAEDRRFALLKQIKKENEFDLNKSLQGLLDDLDDPILHSKLVISPELGMPIVTFERDTVLRYNHWEAVKEFRGLIHREGRTVITTSDKCI